MTFEVRRPKQPEPEKPLPSTGQKLGAEAKELARPFARTGAGVLAQAIGTPGDLFAMFNLAAKPVAEAITGEPGVEYENTALGKLIPTSATHRKRLNKAAGGNYLMPQNETEQFIDDVLMDTASLFLPGKIAHGAKIAGPSPLNLKRSLLTSLGANVIGKGTEAFTKDESKAGLAKMGSMFLLSVALGRPKADQFVSNLYKQADAAIPPGATVKAGRLSNNLGNLKEKLSLGSLSDAEKLAVDEIDTILGKVKDGSILVQELRALKTSINQKLGKLLGETKSRADRKYARSLIKKIHHELDNELVQYGKQNPAFGKPFEAADEAFAAIKNSNVVTKWIEDHLPHTGIAAHLAPIFGSAIGTGAATLLAPYQAGKLLYRIWKSPALTGHYIRAVSAAAAQDVPAFEKEVKKLDEKLEQEQSQGRYQIKRPSQPSSK